jgi:hypothetical protein
MTEVVWSSNHFSAVVRVGQTTLISISYLQQNNFNQQRFQADGILIPHLQKALFVSGHVN